MDGCEWVEGWCEWMNGCEWIDVNGWMDGVNGWMDVNG